MQKRFIDPSELTEEYVKASLEETVRIANEIPQSRFFAESFENFPRDENGYVILTKEQAGQIYPGAMPVDDFFEQLEISVKKGNHRLV